MCYVAGMRCILVLSAALLLGGCVYNPYTGLWQPAGYYGYGYRPYYPSPYYGSPYYGYLPPPSGYQGSPQPSGPIQSEPLPTQQDSLKRSSHHLLAEDQLYCRLLAAVSSEQIHFVTKAAPSPCGGAPDLRTRTNWSGVLVRVSGMLRKYHRRTGTRSDLGSTKPLRNQMRSIFCTRDDTNLGPCMNAAKTQQFLSRTATLLRRMRQKVHRLDGSLVEQDIAARRQEALIGLEFAKQVDRIDAALQSIKSNLDLDQWCKQTCECDISTMRRRKRLYKHWKEYETKRRELGSCGQTGLLFALSLVKDEPSGPATNRQRGMPIRSGIKTNPPSFDTSPLPTHHGRSPDRTSQNA